jgi:hypothetical protein
VMSISFLKFTNTSVKRNLVIVRAGTESLHPLYFYPADENINWDRLVLTYVKPSSVDLEKAEFVVQGGLTKWTDLTELMSINFFDKMGYEYVLLIDDDMLPSQIKVVNLLFDFARSYRFEVCQPALTHNSHFHWLITLRSPAFQVRFTNFVECMAPVFSASALTVMRDELAMAISGCGLDLIFSELFDMSKNPLGIIDAAPFRHTKPIDHNNGSFYKHLRAHGVDPTREVHNYLSRFNLKKKVVITLGGVSTKQTMEIPLI